LQEVSHLKSRHFIVASNAGNAPLHDYEASYNQESHKLHLAAKDNETPERPISSRKYFCIINRNRMPSIDIGPVTFNIHGRADDMSVRAAVGGRPLLHEGKIISLGEVLKTSLSDPRHVLDLPEIDLGNDHGRFMPFGLKTIQRQIINGQAEELMAKVRAGEPILIQLEEERQYDSGITASMVLRALHDFDYTGDDYELSSNGEELSIQLRLKSYRHTFWAIKKNDVIIGIIGNNVLERPDGIDDYLFDRRIKSTGGSIPELQDLLRNKLGVEAGIILGGGKDPRLCMSNLIEHRPKKPEDMLKGEQQILSRSNGEIFIDNTISTARRTFEEYMDVDARPSVTAGLVGLTME
jgi:hypothetical protein